MFRPEKKTHHRFSKFHGSCDNRFEHDRCYIICLLVFELLIDSISDIPTKRKIIIMGDSDKMVKMEIDYSSIVDQKLKECDELMKVN
jgi:hypothetical protein